MLNLKYLLFLTTVSFGIVTRAEITGNTYNSSILFYNGATPQDFIRYDLATADLVVIEPTYIASKPLTLFIHGMNTRYTDDLIQDLIRAYIANGKQNFLVLDWGDAAAGGEDFVKVGKRIPSPLELIKDQTKFNFLNMPNSKPYFIGWEKLGVSVGTFLSNIFKKGVVSPKSTHAIGHSFGSHLVSAAAVYVKKIPSYKIGRATGLDPGNFYNPILQKTDADFVDISHTNPGTFGTSRNSGTVDFRVNPKMSPNQPGCPSASLLELLLLVISGGEPAEIVCSHLRAIEFYTESVKKDDNQNFKATLNYQPKAPQVQMGYNCPKTAKGIYNVDTNATPPYSKT